MALRHHILRDRAEKSLGDPGATVRPEAEEVSAETLGFLPDRGGNIRRLDDGDLGLHTAVGGVSGNQRT